MSQETKFTLSRRQFLRATALGAGAVVLSNTLGLPTSIVSGEPAIQTSPELKPITQSWLDSHECTMPFAHNNVSKIAPPSFDFPVFATTLLASVDQSKDIAPSRVPEVYPSRNESLQTVADLIAHFEDINRTRFNIENNQMLDAMSPEALKQVRDELMPQFYPRDTRTMSIVVSDLVWNHITKIKDELGVRSPEHFFQTMVDASNAMLRKGELPSHKLYLREIIRVADNVAPDWRVLPFKNQQVQDPPQPGNWRYHKTGSVYVPQCLEDDVMVVHPSNGLYPTGSAYMVTLPTGETIDGGWIHEFVMHPKELTWTDPYWQSGQVFRYDQDNYHLKRVLVDYASIMSYPGALRITGCDTIFSGLFQKYGEPTFRGVQPDTTWIGGWRNAHKPDERIPSQLIWPKRFRIQFEKPDGTLHTRKDVTDGWICVDMSDNTHGPHRFEPLYDRSSYPDTAATFTLDPSVAEFILEPLPPGVYNPDSYFLAAMGFGYTVEGVIYHIPAEHLSAAAAAKMYNGTELPDSETEVRFTITLVKDSASITIKPGTEFIEVVKGRPLVTGGEAEDDPNSSILAYYRIGNFGGTSYYGIICDKPIDPEKVRLYVPPPPPLQTPRSFLPVVIGG